MRHQNRKKDRPKPNPAQKQLLNKRCERKAANKIEPYQKEQQQKQKQKQQKAGRHCVQEKEKTHFSP